MYKVIKHFLDLQDNEYSYSEGDIFPRKGYEVTETRLKELLSAENRQRTPLIELVEEKPIKPKRTKKKATE